MEVLLIMFGKFISSYIMMSVIVCIWHKLLNLKIKFKSSKLYLIIFILSIISILNYYIVNQYFRILSITIFLIFGFLFLFKGKSKITVLTPVYTQFIFMISEMIFAILIVFLLKLNSNSIVSTQFGQFFSNIYISLISLLISQAQNVTKFHDLLLQYTNKIQKNQVFIFSIIIMIIANILSGALYYRIDFIYLLIFNTCLTLFCFGIVINTFKTKNNYIKVYDKYNTTLNSLKEYEDILDRYRVSNHENKNQLLTIRNMIPKSNKKTISYIDKIVENKLKDNDKVMFEVSIIPAGGLRGLIYSKVLTMKDLKINYELEISNSVKTVDLISLDDSLMLDICQVIGVYLDNAIEEVKKLDEKYINIEMYMEEKDLIIEISNNYNGNIDFEKIEDKGYTSKGKGHGYGLTLVKEILGNNKKLSNQKKISRESFTQVLKIKM